MALTIVALDKLRHENFVVTIVKKDEKINC